MTNIEKLNYDDLAKVVILRKLGYIVDNTIQVINPLTKVDLSVDIDSEQGKYIINYFFKGTKFGNNYTDLFPKIYFNNKCSRGK